MKEEDIENKESIGDDTGAEKITFNTVTEFTRGISVEGGLGVEGSMQGKVASTSDKRMLDQNEVN